MVAPARQPRHLETEARATRKLTTDCYRNLLSLILAAMRARRSGGVVGGGEGGTEGEGDKKAV